MPKTGCTFINKFLLPNLDSEKFGLRLQWLDRSYDIFQLQWNHKSASDWTRDDAEVFVEWDKIKHRDLTDQKDYFSKSKQRFRANLYKLLKAGRITELKYSDDKYTKVYCIGDGKKIPKNIKPTIMKEKPFIPKCEFNPESFLDIERCRSEIILNKDRTPLYSHTDVSLETNISSENEHLSSGYHSENENSVSLYPMMDDIEPNANALSPLCGLDPSYATMHVNLIQLSSDTSLDFSSLGLESSLKPYCEEPTFCSPYTLNEEDNLFCDSIKLESSEFGDLESTNLCEIANVNFC